MYPESNLVMTSLKTESDYWDRVRPLELAFCEFLRHGSVCFALCFLIIFGRKVVTTLDLLCAEILASCSAFNVGCVSQGGIKIGDEAKASGLAVVTPGVRKNLVEMLSSLFLASCLGALVGRNSLSISMVNFNRTRT